MDEQFIKVSTETGLEVSEGLNFEDGLRLLGSGINTIMHMVKADVQENVEDEEQRNTLLGSIYDMTNIMCGNILDNFDPDRKPATDLTAQAILEAENAILDREVPETPTEDKEETDLA